MQASEALMMHQETLSLSLSTTRPGPHPQLGRANASIWPQVPPPTPKGRLLFLDKARREGLRASLVVPGVPGNDNPLPGPPTHPRGSLLFPWTP